MLAAPQQGSNVIVGISSERRSIGGTETVISYLFFAFIFHFVFSWGFCFELFRKEANSVEKHRRPTSPKITVISGSITQSLYPSWLARKKGKCLWMVCPNNSWISPATANKNEKSTKGGISLQILSAFCLKVFRTHQMHSCIQMVYYIFPKGLS